MMKAPDGRAIDMGELPMIIWSGWGLLTVLIGGAGLFAGAMLDALLVKAGAPANSGMALGALAAAVVNWIVGKRLNDQPGRELVDPNTGQRVILRSRHTLFWIPMQYFSVLLLLFALFGIVAVFGGASKPA